MSSVGQFIVGTLLIHRKQRCSSRLVALRRLSWTSQGDVRCGCSRASTTRPLSVCNDRKKLYGSSKAETISQQRQMEKKIWEHHKCYRLKLKVEERRQNEVDSDVVLFFLRQTTGGVTLAVRHATSSLVKSLAAFAPTEKSGGYETCRVSRIR